MDRKQIRPPDLPDPNLGICYFVDRRQVGEEVRFPRPPVVTEPVTEKHEPSDLLPPWVPPPELELHRRQARARVLFMLVCSLPLLFLFHISLLVTKAYYPPLPAEVTPADPQFGQFVYVKIAGKQLRYMYWGPYYGWIDP